MLLGKRFAIAKKRRQNSLLVNEWGGYGWNNLAQIRSGLLVASTFVFLVDRRPDLSTVSKMTMGLTKRVSNVASAQHNVCE